MKKCSFCGHENNDLNNYCEHCGHNLNEVLSDTSNANNKAIHNSKEINSVTTNKRKYEGKWFNIFYLVFTLVFSITLFASVFSVWNIDFFNHYSFGYISILNAFKSVTGNGAHKEAFQIGVEITCLITLFALLCVSFLGIIFNTIDLAKMKASKKGKLVLMIEVMISFILLYVYSLSGIGEVFINFELVIILLAYFIHIFITRFNDLDKQKYVLLNDGALLPTFIAFSVITGMVYTAIDNNVDHLNHVYTSSIFGFIYLFDVPSFFLVYIPILVLMIMSLASIYLIFKGKYFSNSILGYIATFIAILAIFTTNAYGFEVTPLISFIVFNLIQSSLTLIYYFIRKEKKA